MEVLRTNVQKNNEAKQIIQDLLKHFPDSKINFDLEDCDKILRVESDYINFNYCRIRQAKTLHHI